ncbi:unnamed protein product [Rhizophagus irregularis]|nr:unnamed protein product [Rhizophagus irregularis]
MAIRKSQPVLPKELFAICISHDSATKYYYSTLGKKTGWRSYDNTMALKTMLSRPLNPSIQDTTPAFLLNPSNPSNPSRNLRNLEGIFRHPIKIDRELIIIPEQDTTPTWSGIIKNNTLFLRVSSLEYDSLKESIVAVIELAEELLKCDTLVICLDRNDKNSSLSTLIRSFFYFGFELVPPGTYNHSNEFILVGMEL